MPTGAETRGGPTNAFTRGLRLPSPRVVSEGAWSLAGTVVSVLAGLASVKIITRLVDAESYGRASLVLGIVALVNGLVTGPAHTAQVRIYFDYLGKGLGRWFAREFNRILAVCTGVGAATYLIIAMVYGAMGHQLYLTLAIPALFLIMAQPYFSRTATFLEAHRQQRQLAILNTVQKALYPLILLGFLLTPVRRDMSIVVAQAIALVVLALGWRAPRGQMESAGQPDGGSPTRDLRNALLGFGWSLPLSWASMWVLTTLARYVLEHFRPLSEVGVYTINFSLWATPFILLNGWLETLTRPIIFGRAAALDQAGIRRAILQRLAVGMAAAIAGMALLWIAGPWIARLLLGERYWAGRTLTLVICAAQLLMVAGYSLTAAFLAIKKAYVVAVVTACGGGANLIACLILVPTFGMIGAAWSCLIGYLVWTAIFAVLAFREFRTNRLPTHGPA